MSNAKRWMFVHDDDGYDYLIPVALENDFKAWLDCIEEELNWKGEAKFEEYRCDYPSSYSFVDPRQDV